MNATSHSIQAADDTGLPPRQACLPPHDAISGAKYSVNIPGEKEVRAPGEMLLARSPVGPVTGAVDIYLALSQHVADINQIFHLKTFVRMLSKVPDIMVINRHG